MTAKITHIDFNYLIGLHQSGMSVKKLSDTFNIARVTICKHFKELGFQQRNRHEAELLIWQQMPPDKRKKQYEKAHQSRINKHIPLEESINRAKSWEKFKTKIGKYEDDFFNHFIRNGLNAHQQTAVERYNIDITIDDSIAVEILFNAGQPTRRKPDIKKIKYLLKHNWTVIYFWSCCRPLFTQADLEYFTSFIQSLRSDPSGRGKYFVIGRNRKLYSTGSLDSIN